MSAELTARVRQIMEGLADDIAIEAVNRGKSATGTFVNGLSVSVLSGDTFVVAEGRAPEHWRYVGNGRGPGRMPPPSRLKPWLRAKGIDVRAAYPMARKIGREGSEDYRNRRPNVIATVVGRYVDQGKFNVGPELAKGIRERILQDFTNLKKAA